ncbi:MAG TPA: hypothetical protein ENH85_13620, partial [Candidatus Scalindua sp.]|nr:hypothetical protein [Candidatus Scalindua sp.]
MEQIMKEVNNLFDLLVAKNKSVDILTAKLTARDKKQEETATVHAEKDIDLRGRETKVAKVENVLVIQQNNKETLRKIMQEREKLADAISSHAHQIAKDKHGIEIREKGIKDDFATLGKREAKLIEDRKNLEEDKKTYKA